MCIRDSHRRDDPIGSGVGCGAEIGHLRSRHGHQSLGHRRKYERVPLSILCLLYTSDAADERSSVDLGGRRIIKKKKKETTDKEYNSKKKRKTQ